MNDVILAMLAVWSLVATVGWYGGYLRASELADKLFALLENKE